MSHKDQLNYTTAPGPILVGSCLWELFGRIEKLEAQSEPLAIPHSEGHPIPDYDEAQCSKLYKAVFAPLKQGIEDAELNLIDAVYAFLDHRDNYPDNPYGHDVEIRAWGEQDYLNYEAMEQAARALSDL